MDGQINDLCECREALLRMSIDMAHPGHPYHCSEVHKLVDAAIENLVEAIVLMMIDKRRRETPPCH